MNAQNQKYSLSATDFASWCVLPENISRVRGIIEHHLHHKAVTKYQLPNCYDDAREIDNSKAHWMNGENMPLSLRSSYLIASEKTYSTMIDGLKMTMRIDQLYLMRDGFYIIVDTKSHLVPTFQDQIQLSFNALVIRKQFNVAPVAYVRSCYEQVSYEQIELIPSEALIEVIKSL